MSSMRTTLQEHVIDSHFLGETLSMRLYLPPNYSPLYTYPLIIAQDGPDYFNLGRLGSQLDQFILDDQLQKVIVCGIPYPDVLTRWSRYHPKGEAHLPYLNFLHRELLPSLRKKVAIEDLAQGVTLLGDSLGGTVSLLAAMAYPLTFGNLILQSPYINDAILDHLPTELHPTVSIYHSVGRQEREVRTTQGSVSNFYKANQELHKKLEALPLSRYAYVEHDGDHTWGSWQKDLPEALLYFYSLS